MTKLAQKNFWKVNRFSYTHIFKPVLSISSVDNGHHLMLSVNSIIGRSKIARRYLRLAFSRGRDNRLAQKVDGIQFDNPVGIPAGYDKNGKVVSVLASIGFGFSTIGSVTANQCPGNRKPWIYPLKKTMSFVVNAGLCNEGAKAIVNRIARLDPKTISGFPIILSVAKTNSKNVVSVQEGVDDYIATIRRAKSVQTVSIFELNISCPNTYGGEPFTTPDRLEVLLNAVDAEKLKQPVYIKMPVDMTWDDFRRLLDTAAKHSIAGVTIANLTKDRQNPNIIDDLPEKIRGNFSGRLTWNLSNELIKRTYENYGNRFNIIGVGGIFTAEDAYEKIKLGATLVEFITAFMFYGPQLPSEINEGLSQLLEKDGFDNISQAIGIDTTKKW